MSKPRLLILGTDAAGKNFLGQLLLRRLRAAGLEPAFRERALSARDNGGVEKDKSALGHLAEWAFVSSYPLLRPLMPLAVDALLALDLARARRDERAVIIVSHTALRLAAFDLGHRDEPTAGLALPPRTRQLLARLRAAHGGDAVVLDIAHATRRARVQSRGERSDPFDRYLAARPALSERIEDCMVAIATEHLGATLIVNDDLGEAELLAAVARASASFAAATDASADQ